MIGAVRTWLTSIAAVTLLLTVVEQLIPEGTLRKLAGFTGGLLLLAALLQPVLRTERLEIDFSGYSASIQQRTEELESAGKEQMAAIIAGRTAAYISDKAETLGLAVAARVETAPGEDGIPLPVSAELEGSYSQELADWVARELGIPAERQVWHEGKN
ncbi:MAG: stage III sporulation protein AF [Oscillibacter sp.]|nr:stage III sporulation protein AF [Oscillibacter sp.]